MTHSIHTLRWNPPASVGVHQQGVYILHGTGEHAARYEGLALRLANAGFRVGAHDHPGHGKSFGKRGVIDPPGALVTQAAIQCQAFAAETGCPPVVFGHSLGGVAATELVFEHKMPINGLILSAPAFAPFIKLSQRVLVELLFHLAPTYTVERPYSADQLTQDDVVRQSAEADPLNHGFKSASLIGWLLSSGKRQLVQAPKLSVDTLLLIAESDSVVDASRALEFGESAPPEKLTVKEYEGYFHEILNESPDRAERVLNDVESWMTTRFGTLA